MQITSTAQAAQGGFSVLVHGASGMGKTRLCATTGDPERTLIANVEQGLLSLRGENIPVANITCMKDMYDLIEFMKTDQQYTWLCLDSISELGEMCLKEKMALTKDGRQAYGWMSDAMLDILKQLRSLPKNVYIIAKQMAGENSGVMGPAMPGKQLSIEGKHDITYLFDEVLALVDYTHEETQKTYRCLQTFRDDRFECKERSGALAPYEQPVLQKIQSKIMSKGE
jgi:phage nucleotide-binding protein